MKYQIRFDGTLEDTRSLSGVSQLSSYQSDFGFLHVWKCGGTTVEALTGSSQLLLQSNEGQARQGLALVQDPIDRFLSAWAQCGVRLCERRIKFIRDTTYSSLNWRHEEYDYCVRAFLLEVQPFCPLRSCTRLSTSQFHDRSIENNCHVVFVGELSEMRQGLGIAGFQMGTKHLVERDAGQNMVKSLYFPSDRNLLSRSTLLELCEFLALDYFLFDFVPPTIWVEDGAPLATMRVLGS
jgi:hypothetical protein